MVLVSENAGGSLALLEDVWLQIAKLPKEKV